jgi:hypothetical protein
MNSTHVEEESRDLRHHQHCREKAFKYNWNIYSKLCLTSLFDEDNNWPSFGPLLGGNILAQ